MTDLQRQTLIVAKRFMGAREDLGANRGTVIRRFQLFIGRWMVGQPWCAAYATFCIHIAAQELGIKTTFIKSASSSAIYAWAKKNHRLLSAPAPGCVFVVRKGGSGDDDRRSEVGKSHIHTGLVHTVNPDGVLITVEGNASNRVRWGKRSQAGLDFIEIV